MPVTVTYPGVYIDELPSQVRTIVGVPTSITAFVGSAARGDVDEPVHITSWSDFVRHFGGLSGQHLMSYMVFQYYQNGGSEAEIVRVAHLDDDDDENKATAATLNLGEGVELVAASVGEWGSSLRARVEVLPKEKDADPDLFNLVVRDTGTGEQESFLNVEAKKDSPRALTETLERSALVRAGEDSDDDKVPTPSAPGEPGKDPFADVNPAEDDGNGGDGPDGDGGGDGDGGDGPNGDGDGDGGDGPNGDGNGGGDGDGDGNGNGGDAADAGGAMYVQAEGGADGTVVGDADLQGDEAKKSGVYALLKLGDRIFNLLCIAPGSADVSFYDTAAKFCLDQRAVLLVDPPSDWTDVAQAVAGAATPSVSGANAKNAAQYFPRLKLADENGNLQTYPPSGAMAGVIARTDGQIGVWKAAAGTDASVSSVLDLTVKLTDLENGRLNPLGVNCIRNFPVIGTVVWGARTMRGADQLADQWKYLPVRRTALYIEESLYRGTQWVVFQPNDEPLWSSIRLNVGAFMNSLWRRGAFQGTSPDQAYLVKCDAENNPQNDIDRGIVNILVGFAPLKPAEFVVIHIQQLAGQIQT